MPDMLVACGCVHRVVISGSIGNYSLDGASGGGEALGHAPFSVVANLLYFFMRRWNI